MGTGGLGKGMIVAAWVLLLGLLTLLFQDQLAHWQNPNQALVVEASGGQPLVRLQRNRAGHYLAPGQINGAQVLFLLDTGATSVALPAALADRLGLPRLGEVQSLTANGTVRAWRTRLEEVRLGPIVLHRVSGVIMPDMPGEHVLLGMSFLRFLEIVQRDGELILSMSGRSG